MTEQEAIERIAKAFKRDAPGCSDEYLTARATTAWNELKAIAREDARRLPRWFTDLPTEEAIDRLCRDYPRTPQKTLGPGL